MAFQLAKLYEDYLESFVFKTAKLIAMKLFGRERRSRRDSEESYENVNEPKKEDDLKTSEEIDEKLNNEESDRKAEILDNLLNKQEEEKNKEQQNKAARLEYDSLTEGLDEINFHFVLFFLLIVITMIAIPSSITWAKNYNFSRILSPDPFKIPATITLISLGVIWQLNTPRNV